MTAHAIIAMASLLRRHAVTCQCSRTFSTSAPRSVNLRWEKNDPEVLAQVLPAYPYGPTLLYKQSRTGLYGGQRIRFGNNVGHKIEVKTRRNFKPNIQTRRLFSKALDRTVQVRVSTRVLRTIDKLGGIDEYLLGEKEARIKELGESGWWLRWAIMQTPAIKEQFAAQRQKYGLTGSPSKTISNTVEAALLEAAGGERLEVVDATKGGLDELSSEVLTKDNVFSVISDPSKKPIKFRVGPGQTVYLSENGWRRTKPSTRNWETKKKAEVEERYFPTYYADAKQAFETRMNKVLSRKGDVEMSKTQHAALRKTARKQIREHLDQLVTAHWDRRRKTWGMAKMATEIEQKVQNRQAQLAKEELETLV